jgi:tetrapyrrole methylase family protein/MazG family protein
MTTMARQFGVDPESALRLANSRFRNRFTYIENHLNKNGRQIQGLSKDEYRNLWKQASSVFP